MSEIEIRHREERSSTPLDKGKEPIKEPVKESVKGSLMVSYDSVPGLKRPDIQRLSFEAGIKSLDGAVYEEIREILNDYVRDFARKAALIMTAEDHKILTVSHLSAAMKANGKEVAAIIRESPEDTSYLKKCSLPIFKGDHQFLKKIRYYQSQSDSLIFEKGPFRKFLKWVISQIEISIGVEKIKLSPGFVLLSQFLCENYTVNLFRKANKCCIHAGRQTVQTRDLALVLELGAI